MRLSSIYPRTSATPISCLGQVPPWTRSQAGSARAVQRAVMESAPGSADARLLSGCLGRAVPPLLLRLPGRAVPGGAYMVLNLLKSLDQKSKTQIHRSESGQLWGLTSTGTTAEKSKQRSCYINSGEKDKTKYLEIISEIIKEIIIENN